MSDILADGPPAHPMLSASACRAKASAALAGAASQTQPGARLEWQDMARQWSQLAATADVQDLLMSRLGLVSH
jgi:hypothetical protein